MNNYRYQVGGSLSNNAPSYVVRKADTEIYHALTGGEFCYVFNSRQMGKSSLLVRTLFRLRNSFCKCVSIDLSILVSNFSSPLQWYKGLITELWLAFELYEQLELETWWREHKDHYRTQKLCKFIDLLLSLLPNQKLFIFIDEIDSILGLSFAVDDFFAVIRHCYNQRAINPEYNRLSFALFGVVTPSDLIKNKNLTPFNIGKAISLEGFEIDETEPLILGLQSKVDNPRKVMAEILSWTGGQPFLTQKICQLILDSNSHQIASRLKILDQDESWLRKLIEEEVIQNWKSQDEPEHLRTIRDRLLGNPRLTGRVLSIYQHILRNEDLETRPLSHLYSALSHHPESIFDDDSPEKIQLLLSGLIVKKQGCLKIKNRIYREIFNQKWVEKKLLELRPYSQIFNDWLASEKKDSAFLLNGQELLNAQVWAHNKSLSDLDYQFLAASQEAEETKKRLALESEKAQEIAARLREQENRRIQEKKNTGLQIILLSVLSIAFLLSVGLSATVFLLYRKAISSEQIAEAREVEAVTSASRALYLSNQRLNALIEAMRAMRLSQNLNQVSLDLKHQLNFALKQSIYGAIESNRFLGHTSNVNAVSFSPDGKMLVSGGKETLKFWRRDGKLLKTIDVKNNAIYSLDYSPDGKLIVGALGDGTAKIWNARGELVTTLTGHQATVWFATFSSDGQLMLTASQDGNIKLWQRDGKLLQSFKGYDSPVYGIAIRSDNSAIASTSTDGTVKIWNRNGKVLATLTGHKDAVWSVAFSPDGKLVATSGQDQTVRLWQPNGTLIKTLRGHTAAIWGVKFSPDGKFLVSSSVDRTARIWSRDGRLLRSLEGHEGIVWGIDISPDNSTVATTSWDNSIRLWRTNNPLVYSIKTPEDSATRVSFSPDNKTFATASLDGSIQLWTIQDKKLIKILGNHGVEAWALDWSQDGTFIASGGADNTIKLWSQDKGLLHTLSGHLDAVYGLKISPDSQLIASRSLDGVVKIWRRDGSLVRTLRTGQVNNLVSLDFSPDGNKLATAAANNQVQLWSIDGVLLKTLKTDSTVKAVNFNNNGTKIAIAESSASITLWNVNGELEKKFQLENSDHENINSIQFSPNDEMLIISLQNKILKSWEIEFVNIDGKTLKHLFGHQGDIHFDISQDGKILVSVSLDQSIGIWDLNKVFQLEDITFACNWVGDYLRTSIEVRDSDRKLCQ